MDSGPNRQLATRLADPSTARQHRVRTNGSATSGGDAETATAAPGSTSASGLASPRAIMILLPALVLAVGMALLYIGQTALSGTSRSMAAERFRLQTSLASQRIGDALQQAEPVLDRLAQMALLEDVRAAPEDTTRLLPIALELRDLIDGRPGMTQAYLAFPDGRFVSADQRTQDTIEFQLTLGAASHQYRLSGLELERLGSEPSSYDPTRRDWYQLAVSEPSRTWSQPYSFWFNGTPGVTRVQAVRLEGEPVAVVGVDFDVQALTRFMALADTKDVHSVVLTEEGVILAYPNGQQAMARLDGKNQGRGGKAQVATYENLDDPVLEGLFRALRADPRQVTAGRYLRYDADGSTMLATVQALGGAGPPWLVATVSAESSVLTALRTYRTRSLVVALLALTIAVLVAWAFARRIVEARREAVKARQLALAAEEKVRRLGSYRLVERIGEGGMGEVWQARHHLLARQAAIKLIRTNVFEGPKQQEMEQRFRREAQAIAGLRSRNTIELFDYGTTEDGTLFYVMELLDGIDLQTLVERHGPQNPERVRQIMLQAANSLGEAHDYQLVHRDVKPANIFLCRAAEEVDVVKVLDFGLVLSPLAASDPAEQRPLPEAVYEQPGFDPEARLTQADAQLGTPGFMSPEQALGAHIDGRGDIYSLACVAWWLLTGKLPYRAETALGTMLKHIQAPVPDIDEHLERPLPPSLKQLLESCLAKSVEGRPQNAQELISALLAMGSLSDAWNDAAASAWWREFMPPPKVSPAHLSLRPPEPVHVVSHGERDTSS